MARRTAKTEAEKVTKKEAITMCRKGLTPGAVERGLSGAGLDYLRAKFTTPAAKIAGLAVYYGIITQGQANDRLQDLYGKE